MSAETMNAIARSGLLKKKRAAGEMSIKKNWTG